LESNVKKQIFNQINLPIVVNQTDCLNYTTSLNEPIDDPKLWFYTHVWFIKTKIT